MNKVLLFRNQKKNKIHQNRIGKDHYFININVEINDIENKNKRKIDKSKGCTFEMTSNNTELRKNRSKYSKSKNYIGNHRNRKKKEL